MPDLDIAGIVRVLNAHDVHYVVIGGVAALVHDLPVPATVDIDVTPARDNENLRRLADAFDDLDAELLTADEAGTWFPRHPVENWSSYDTLHLMTRLGALDVVFVPDGAPGGYDDLATSAAPHSVLAKDAHASSCRWRPGSDSRPPRAGPRTLNTSTATTADSTDDLTDGKLPRERSRPAGCLRPAQRGREAVTRKTASALACGFGEAVPNAHCPNTPVLVELPPIVLTPPNTARGGAS